MKAAKTEAKPAETPKKELGKTLVAYITKGGATGEAATTIANTLREKCGLQVDLVDLKKQPKPDIAQYSNVVIGGGVRAGTLYKEAVDFVKQDFSGKRVGFFICSGAAGNRLRHDEVLEKYITKGLAAYNVKLVSKGAFGGCIKILGITVTDRRDPVKVQAWAEELGKKFIE
jgi:menaquinone-dependent protoporphyrinogen IX oxidase